MVVLAQPAFQRQGEPHATLLLPAAPIAVAVLLALLYCGAVWAAVVYQRWVAA